MQNAAVLYSFIKFVNLFKLSTGRHILCIELTKQCEAHSWKFFRESEIFSKSDQSAYQKRQQSIGILVTQAKIIKIIFPQIVS